MEMSFSSIIHVMLQHILYNIMDGSKLDLPSGEERDGEDEESGEGLTVDDEDGGTESFHESSFREECNSRRRKLQHH